MKKKIVFISIALAGLACQLVQPIASPQPTTLPTFGSHQLPDPSQVISNIGVSDPIFSPDGKLIAGIYAGDVITILDAITFKQLSELNDYHWISTLAFSPDSTRLVFNHMKDIHWGEVSRWDIGEPQASLLSGASDGYYSDFLLYSPDGRVIAWGAGDVLLLLDAESGSLLENQPVLPALQTDSAAFSPDGELLAICCSQSSIILWNIHKSEVVGSIPEVSAIPSLVFTSEGAELIGFDPMNSRIHKWDLKTLEPSQPPIEFEEVPSIYLGDASFSPDGRFLAACYSSAPSSYGLATLLMVVDVEKGELLGLMEPHLNCYSVAFNAEGNKLVVDIPLAWLVWEMDSLTE